MHALVPAVAAGCLLGGLAPSSMSFSCLVVNAAKRAGAHRKQQSETYPLLRITKGIVIWSWKLERAYRGK